MSSRKFANTLVKDLESLARSQSAGRQTLEEICEELNHRGTARAQAAKVQIGAQLAAMPPVATQVTPDTEAAPPPTTTGQLTPAEIARYGDALERIRARLLDLSANNMLLHYKHPKGSSLRIVNEVPAQIFAKLVANQTLSFAALPEPPSTARNDDGGEPDATGAPPLSAVETGTPAIPGVSLDPKEQGKAERRAAQARREAVRITRARALHIDPGYELPATESSNASAYRDSKLQTLLFPEELESQLHKIHREADRSVQETGVNRLHLMFGFVRWRESAAFQEPKDWRHAPLVLLPVRLRRGNLDPATHTYRYVLERSGEDWSANVTLQEKCRREFGLEVPDVDPEADENIEQYFARIETVLRHAPAGWSLCRFVTLGLVSFGKILMWRDLDPATWPAARSIFDSAPLCQLLGTEGEPSPESAASSAESSEYPIDDLPAGRGRVPPIIVDADSSQHSALVDAERGLSLVVQGPPGTGKSQTITNLVASALRHGKRVLFVAEKKTALDIVYSRLAEAGLGDFCVALHSRTSAKRQFLDDLAHRLALRGQLRTPRELAPAEARLAEARKTLSQHDDRVHTPFGAIQLSPFEIFWRTRRLIDALGEDVLSAIGDLRLPQVTRATQQDLDQQRDTVADFAAAYGGVREEGPVIERHPWAGVAHEDLSYAEVEDLLDAAREWRAGMFALRVEVDAIAAMVSETAEGAGRGVSGASPKSLDALRYGARDLVALADTASAGLPHAILTTSSVSAVRTAVAAVEECRATWASIEGNWRIPGALRREHAEWTARAITTADSAFGAMTSLGRIAGTAEMLRAQIHVIEEAERALGVVRRGLGLECVLTPDIARALVAVADTASHLDRATLDRRCEATSSVEDVAALRMLAGEAEALRAARQAIDARFAPPFRPERSTLQQIARSLAAAPNVLPWLLSGAYRRARRQYREMAGGVAAPRGEMIRDVRTILEHQDAVSRFADVPLLAGIFDQGTRGIDSPFDKAMAAAEWHAALRVITAPLGEPGRAILRAVWATPTVQWREMLDRTSTESDAWRAAQTVEEALRLAGMCDGAAMAGVDGWHCMALSTIRERLVALLGMADAIETVAEDAGTGPEVTVAGLEQRLAAVRAAWMADDRLDAQAHVLAGLELPVRGLETNVAPVQAALQYIVRVRSVALPESVANWLLGPDSRARLVQLQTAVDRLGRVLDEYGRRESSVGHLGHVEVGPWCRVLANDMWPESLASASLSLLERRLDLALARDRALHGWAHYQRARAAALGRGLSSLTTLIESERLDRTLAADAYEAVFYGSLAGALLRADRALDTFDSAVHEEVQGRFAALDRNVLEFMQRQIAAELVSAPAVPGTSGRVSVRDLTEEALIKHEAGKQRGHIAIRKLFERAGRAIQTMKPCFLMGPQAVAQYLAPGKFEFDLVVMDEASQMRCEDALGAIARGRQVIIVGDPMQLGPTKFFDKQDDDDDSEEYPDGDEHRNDGAEREAPPVPSGPTVLERSESILLAAAVRFPVRMLRWHYRSRHPKLIAFSNREFYRGKLIVFPTPAVVDEHDGVFFNHVTDAVYEDRRNEKEAAAVVEAIRCHARNVPERSLLVATLNKDQANLIDRLVEEAEKDDEAIQAFRARHEETREPFRVRNLESVQGDERDVILVSITFGHNAAGKLNQNFGPILQHGGERRLNVLFTRAKHRVEVFCSFDPSELRVGDGAPRGLRILRDYLRYAQGEVWWAAGTETGREPDSDFEIAVATALKSHGYEVRPQIGVAGYFIDLAVVDPDLPGRFILGLECDGATYHSAKSARDRDRLRQQQLEALGWTIHRIWSTDWFRDRAGQVNRVAARIEQLRAARAGRLDVGAGGAIAGATS